jgi:uncharacterized protein with HEPN domain
MSRDYRVCLEEVLEAAGKVRRYMAGISREDFGTDSKTLDAVIRNLAIIGEALKNVSEAIRSTYPQVERRKFAGLRDILIHACFGVDVDIVWDVIQNKLPVLESQIAQILSPGRLDT